MKVNNGQLSPIFLVFPLLAQNNWTSKCVLSKCWRLAVCELFLYLLRFKTLWFLKWEFFQENLKNSLDPCKCGSNFLKNMETTFVNMILQKWCKVIDNLIEFKTLFVKQFLFGKIPESASYGYCCTDTWKSKQN